MGNNYSTATLVASPLTCETPIISSKESNVNNNFSPEERVNLLNTEVIAMQSFIVVQVLILKQSLKDSTLEKSPSDISSEVKRLKGVKDILCQQNEGLLQENLSIMQLLCSCYSRTRNNTEIYRINCSNRFEVLSRTDVDDDRKPGRSENSVTEEFLTNDDVRNRTKIQKSCIANRKYRNSDYPRRMTHRQTIIDVKKYESVSRTNKIIKDHHENRLSVNRMTSTYSNVVRNKKKNIVLFTDSIPKTLCMGELDRYINGGKVHLKSFPGSKANKLNHPILEEHQYDVAAIHVRINDLLKGMPNNVTVDSICNDIREIALRCHNHNVNIAVE